MTSTISDCPGSSLTDAGEFLAEYTAWLLGCGATCIRIEKNVGRIAAAWGLHCDLTVMPRQITIVLSGGTENCSERIFTSRIKPCGINFDINSNLSRLSWNVADRRLPVTRAAELLHGAVSRRYCNTLTGLMLVSLANASFCRLFGGDAAAMLTVFIATLAGYSVKGILLHHHADVRLTFFICSFISAALAYGATLFRWGATPDVALATSVLYLIPGVPYINAASDLIGRHYLCSLSRFADACVLTACLSAGLCLAIKLLGIEWF